MATMVTNASRGPVTLPPVYGSKVVAPKDSVIIADTPANVKVVLGPPSLPKVWTYQQVLDGQPGAILPSGGGGGGGAVNAAKVFEVDAPKAADTSTVSSAGLAASSASSAFVLAGNPDVARNVQVAAGAGWDGGSVTVVGTFFGLPQTETIVPVAGSTVAGVKPFSTVTAASKGAVGASGATATIGVGNALGIPATLANANSVMLADNAAEPATISVANSTFTPTVSVPNGSVDYALIANT